MVGTFLLWFGWYGFNGGSTLYINTYGRDAGRVCVTTTMSAAVGGVTAMLIKKFFPPAAGGSGEFDVGFTCNGILAGLVGITAGCPVISVHASLLVGFIFVVGLNIFMLLALSLHPWRMSACLYWFCSGGLVTLLCPCWHWGRLVRSSPFVCHGSLGAVGLVGLPI